MKNLQRCSSDNLYGFLFPSDLLCCDDAWVHNAAASAALVATAQATRRCVDPPAIVHPSCYHSQYFVIVCYRVFIRSVCFQNVAYNFPEYYQSE